jgi:hypothetical protein
VAATVQAPSCPLTSHPASLPPLPGDLKPDNVLLKEDPASAVRAKAMVADFGLCAALQGSHTHLSNYRSGTPFFTAPEVRGAPHGSLRQCLTGCVRPGPGWGLAWLAVLPGAPSRDMAWESLPGSRPLNTQRAPHLVPRGTVICIILGALTDRNKHRQQVSGSRTSRFTLHCLHHLRMHAGAAGGEGDQGI